MLQKSNWRTMGVAAACGTSMCLGASASASIEVIYSEIAADASSLVPGLAKGTLFQAFDRPYRSPDGTMWIISADTNLATTEDEVILVGSGTSGTVVVREGTPTGTGAGDLNGLLDRNLSINNAGQYCYATNTDAVTTADEKIIRWTGRGFEEAAVEGGAVPGVADELWGLGLDGAFIIANGLVGFHAPSTAGLQPTTSDDFLMLADTVIAQSGVTIPTGQAGDAMAPWDLMDFEDFYMNADGTSSIAQGDLTGDTTLDDVVVVDGAVVIQEGVIIAGSGFAEPVDLNGILEIYMSSSGDWMARGDNATTQQDWVVLNGEVVVVTGDPIITGSKETFSDAVFAACFFSMVANNNGDYVIGGTTSAVDPEADAVLVLNGETVIARQGDVVDLNGNGLPDDDVFIDIFNNDDAFLTDDGWYYFDADLYDGLKVALGQAFLRIQVDLDGKEVTGDLTGDGIVDGLDLGNLLANWSIPAGTPGCGGAKPCPADINGDGVVDGLDLGILLANWTL